MKKTIFFECILVIILLASASFKKQKESDRYFQNYTNSLKDFESTLSQLVHNIKQTNFQSQNEINNIKEQIFFARTRLKKMDFWLRYLEPTTYKKINGPLPVEWETEVFEKFEKPYKREGAGLTLASLYLSEDEHQKDSLIKLLTISLTATSVFQEDSITSHLNSFDHFYLCNRLYLLNLAAIYTTGFECPEPSKIIPELKMMLKDVHSIYLAFNNSFYNNTLPEEYLKLYQQTIEFANNQTDDFETFDHFTFIKDYVNPLFSLNQKLILQYKVVSKSNVDYSLNKNAMSIFSKQLYRGQNSKGVYIRVNDEKILKEIENMGRLLFYDPILSGNNLRSCASCHIPGQYFTDTTITTTLEFNKLKKLSRNTPTLLNTSFNHLLMADGKHLTMQQQAHDVIKNPIEMNGDEKDIMNKILSCKEYKSALKKIVKYTPQSPEPGMEHIVSALTCYYDKFSKFYSPFDEAMNKAASIDTTVIRGFNIFMGKAQCATCHFVPQFNGVKPPYIGSEFEVIGVPADIQFKELSQDKGRFLIHPANETMNAFRTRTIRNAAKTLPYMHNGVFKELTEVIDFYNAGGGAGRGLTIKNQTLSADSLHLTTQEKNALIAFISSLTEQIQFDEAPIKLPESKHKKNNTRKVGGEY